MGRVVRACVRRRLLPLRGAGHAFFAVGLAAALLCLRARGLDWPATALAAFALSAIAHPQHKLFEHAWLLLAWSSCAWLLSAPSPVAWACEGLVLGVSLLFGFNLFLYASAGFALALAVATTTGLLPFAAWRMEAFALGASAGLVPMAAMALSPGFARRFYVRRIGTVIARGESNLSLLLLWPWRPAPAQLLGLDPAHRRAFQWTFLLLPCLPLVAIAFVALRALPPRWTRRRCSPPRRWGWPRSTTPPAAPILRTSCSRWRPRACCCWVVRRRSHRGGSRRSRP